jgi:HK97 family phage major capsid protein
MPAGLTDNRTILQKADLALSDLQTDGGLLVDEQSQRFMRILILRSVIMGMSTVEPMRSPRKEIDKIRFASRVLRAGQSGVALGLDERSKPDTSKVTLDAKLFKAEVRLNNETLEDSIEQGNLRNTVMQELAKAVSRDMEDVLINGDTTSPSAFYAQFDGILRQATSNIVDASNQRLTKSVLRDLQKALPNEFLVNKRDMKYLTSVDAEIDYRDTLADRATAMGDIALGAQANREAQVGYTGIGVVGVPLFPENLGGGNNTTNCLFLDPKNIYVGIHREIRMETDKDITSGEVIIVVTLRFDVKYAEETAVAKATNVLVAA